MDDAAFSRIDIDKLDYAINAANFLAKNYIKSGRYIVDESWGPEGVLYLAESSYALLTAYEFTGNKIYLDSVKSILDELRNIQKPSGGWCLEIGKHGDGIKFKVTEEVRSLTATIEDLPPTVAILKVIADYFRLTDDPQYLSMGDAAFSYLSHHWDCEEGCFSEKENNELLKLRSSPRSYQLFSLIGLKAWRSRKPEAIDLMLPRIIDYVKDTFEQYDSETMPLVFGLHAAVLLEILPLDYAINCIKPKIDEYVSESGNFRIPGLKGGFGHRDGLRGIVKTEAHMRSAAGLAIAMKFYDLKTGHKTYLGSKEYYDVSNWILSMYRDGFFYECEDLIANKKIGYGSPGQYLPIWWVLGRI